MVERSKQMSNEEDTYAQATKDSLAKIVLQALHTQDARTYSGNAEDMGKLALETTEKILEFLRKKA